MFTVQQIKDMLQITNSSKDAVIKSYIPVVTEDLISYCNNHFLNHNYDYFLSSEIVFSNNQIQLSGIGDYNLIVGDYIRIYGSMRNEGTFLISEVASNYLTIDSTFNSLQDEDLNKTVLICLCKYPQSLLLGFSQMINFKLKNYDQGITSKQIDDYSYSLDKDLVNGYPKSIMKNFKRYPYLIDYNAVFGISRWIDE